MNTLARNSLVQAAALAAVWVVASSFAGQSATAKIEDRHPDMMVAQAFDTLEQAGQSSAVRHQTAGTKGDLLVQQTSCGGQAWPYMASECLSGKAAIRKVSRTITIEKRTGEASSTLVRVPAEQRIAAR